MIKAEGGCLLHVGKEWGLGRVRKREGDKRGHSLNPDFATATSYDMYKTVKGSSSRCYQSRR